MAISDEGDGWVLVPSDDHDDDQWKCTACATASDEFFGGPEWRLRDALGLD